MSLAINDCMTISFAIIYVNSMILTLPNSVANAYKKEGDILFIGSLLNLRFGSLFEAM
jgi:hypothetical protein